MTALVTGAAGFIGSHIVQHLLDRGESVKALVRPGRTPPASAPQTDNLVWSHGDLTDPASLKSATENVAVVYHAAALLQAPRNSNAMREVNVGGLRNLMNACVQNRVERLVFISSISVYASSNAPAICEDAPLGGADTYGRTKAEAEALLKSQAGSCGLAYSILRPCVAYGERDHNNLTPRLMQMLRRPVIPVIAGNRGHMLLVHAADIAEAAILAGTRPIAVGQAYNVTGGEPTSLQELAAVYMELTGQNRLLVPVPLALLRGVLLTQWLIRNLRHRRLERMTERYRNREHERSVFLSRHCDITKARTELGYDPKVDLREGMRRTLAWYSSQAPS